jgi:uncharacterized protein (TIGR02145 family)/uncharacterized repeat protein (TIGR02543 family)
MRKSILRTVGLAAIAALVCMVCTDVHDEYGGEYRRRPVDTFLGVYTVTFEIGYAGGTIPPAMAVISGDSITLPDVTMSGYVFDGWNTNSSGSGTNYNAGSTYKPTGNVTLYAKWIRLYSVEFSKCYDSYCYSSASGTAPATIYNVMPGDSVILPSGDSLTMSGYVFDGWITNLNGSGTNYEVGSYYKPTGSNTLYAKWIALYRVEFSTSNNTGNSISGTVPEAITVIPGDSITLPSGDSLTMRGYYFGGWNTDYNGNGTNYNAGSFYKPTGNTYYNITLYAKWNALYSVTFDRYYRNNNGSYPANGTAPATISNVMPGDSVILPSEGNLTRSGYVFGGWNTDSYGNGTNYAAGSYYKPTGSNTLYVKWIAQYKVTFSAYYSSGTAASGTLPADMTVISGDSITLPDKGNLTKTNYVFDGWNTSYEGKGTDYAVGSSYKPTGDVTLYAKWIALYSVSFYENGSGTTGTAPATIYVMPGDSITLPDKGDLTRSGYVFGGWNSGINGSGTNYNAGSFYKPTGNIYNITLYAKWIAQYTITFNASGGTVSPTSGVTGADGTLALLPDPTEKDAGDIFVGWYRAAWGGTAVTTSTVFNSNATIYAQWKFKDTRDDKTYKKVKIGNLTWMAENLNYDGKEDGGSEIGVCYANNTSNCGTYGRLYTWDAAMTACPDDWHLPSDAEWAQMVSAAGGSSSDTRTKLKSTSNWDGSGYGTDDYGFSALPGGYGNGSGNFYYAGNTGYWWSATEYTTDNAYYRYISSNDMGSYNNSKTNLYSVRCVAD